MGKGDRAIIQPAGTKAIFIPDTSSPRKPKGFKAHFVSTLFNPFLWAILLVIAVMVAVVLPIGHNMPFNFDATYKERFMNLYFGEEMSITGASYQADSLPSSIEGSKYFRIDMKFTNPSDKFNQQFTIEMSGTDGNGNTFQKNKTIALKPSQIAIFSGDSCNSEDGKWCSLMAVRFMQNFLKPDEPSYYADKSWTSMAASDCSCRIAVWQPPKYTPQGDNKVTVTIIVKNESGQVLERASGNVKCINTEEPPATPDPKEPPDDTVKDTDKEPDSDNDGIPDNSDCCGDTKGNVGNAGCPLNDRDRDGVPDNVDSCPDVYGEGGDGCPIVTEEDIGWNPFAWLVKQFNRIGKWYGALPLADRETLFTGAILGIVGFLFIIYVIKVIKRDFGREGSYYYSEIPQAPKTKVTQSGEKSLKGTQGKRVGRPLKEAYK